MKFPSLSKIYILSLIKHIIYPSSYFDIIILDKFSFVICSLVEKTIEFFIIFVRFWLQISIPDLYIINKLPFNKEVVRKTEKTEKNTT